MFKTKLYFIFIVLFIFCFGCKTIEPEIPHFDSKVSEEDSNNLYNEYKLEKRGNALLYMYFKQGENEGKINNKSLRILFNQSNEEVKSLYRKSRGLLMASYILSFSGGFCVGWPIGGYIVTKDFDTSDYILFGAGGGLAIIGIITGIISDHKFEDTVFAYNEYLKEMLY